MLTELALCYLQKSPYLIVPVPNYCLTNLLGSIARSVGGQLSEENTHPEESMPNLSLGSFQLSSHSRLLNS